MGYVIFTDLDGTLIDHDTYSYNAAKPALAAIKENSIPLIFCTSKTRAELEEYVKEMELYHPFISENGGAIFIPEDYFDFDYLYSKKLKNYKVIELGTSYQLLRDVLTEIRESASLDVVGFGDMSDEEVSEDTGLALDSARLATKREYDEAFKLLDEDRADELRELIVSRGLNYTRGGRYWHLMGDNDKGKAVQKLTELFRKSDPDVKSVGLGDSQNDLPMLQAVDIPYLVQKPGEIHDSTISDSRINRVEGIGPVGWNRAILKLLSSK
ncbi:mannosyl-3-phosphoglycerate phosphatase [Methanohalophilus levihalophilus]|uniref:mannosyl-3-phosphoglycerate phosphatase n=1 Tax=Methanohalophilus levihalophilus TaxID=1431282 RepID=UPI001AE85BC7|nr:mannosyl-3-phosphoglycerate phosphatase [Methanohalophilus levihalophilus]MBP2029665.1 mannosyl-3-phosphoglycerate phosphatase [Methanohalophilus levihalophilus]